MDLTIETFRGASAKLAAIDALYPAPRFSGEIFVVDRWPMVSAEAWAIFPPHPLWLAIWRLCQWLGLPRVTSPWTTCLMMREADPFMIHGRLHMSPAQHAALKAELPTI